MLINISDVWKTAYASHNRYLEKCINEGIKSLKKTSIEKPATQFLNFLKIHLTAKSPSGLQSSIRYYEKLKRKISRHERSVLDSFLRKTFDYKKFTSKRVHCWSAYKLCKSSTYKICPYCHHAYMLTTKEAEKGIRPDLDHYYPQHRYPYLALALHNLIPSCSICNSRLKGAEDTGDHSYLHPLFDSESLHFRCEKPGSTIVDIVSDFENIKDQLKVRITYDPTCAKSVNTLRMFQLHERYDLFSQQGADFVGSKTSIDGLDELLQAHAIGPLQEGAFLALPPSKEKEMRQLRFDRERYKHYLHGKMFADLYDQFDRTSLLSRPYP